MANMLPCCFHIWKGISIESLYTCKRTNLGYGTWKIIGQKGPVVTNNNKGCYKVQCCSASSTSASSNTKHVLVENRRRNFEDGEDDELEHLVSDFGWKVRRLAMDEHEMREVAQIQAEAFHTPVALFDDLFFQFFKAEVLSGLLYKLRNSPPDRSNWCFGRFNREHDDYLNIKQICMFGC